MSNPVTCQELLDHAKRAEAAASVHQPSPTVSAPTHDDTEEIAAALHRTSSMPSAPHNNRSFRTQHRGSNPYRQQFSSNQHHKYRGQKNSFQVQCYNCYGFGHYSYQCPSHLN